MASREDPLGTFDHVKPVSLEEAARAWQVAEAKVAHAKSTYQFIRFSRVNTHKNNPAGSKVIEVLLREAKERLTKAEEEREDAAILLQRSAFIHPIDWVS